MHYNHYGRDATEFGVSLLNNRPTSATEMAARIHDAGVILDSPLTTDSYQSVMSFLDRWHGVFTATDDHLRATALNELLAEYTGPPRVTDHAGDGWHLHFRDDALPADRQLAALITMGTALGVTGLGMHRLGVCAASDCHQVFADFSRNGRQQYCSPGCANRSAVRRHRAAATAKRAGADRR